MPPSIRDATRSRLDLPRRRVARALLRVAAVIGRTFTLPVLGIVVGRPPDTLLDLLDVAVNRGTIRPSTTVAGSFVFEHILVRDALYRELEPSRRAELHWHVGTALEEVHASDLDPHLAELAHHFLLAIGPGTRRRRAIEYSTRAGQRAMAQTAYDEAAAHYRRALDTLVVGRDERSGPTVRPAPRPRRSAHAQRRHHRRTRTYLEAAALARQRGLAIISPRRRSAMPGSPATTSADGATRRSWPSSRKRSPAFPPGDSEMRVRLLARLSVALYWSDLDGRRFELSEEAVAMARRLRDPATLALAIHSRRYAQWGPDNFEQRLADAAQCRTLAFEANDLELAVSASRWRFTDLLEDGDVAAADRELDAHAELAQRLHQPFLLAYTTQFRALRAIMQGRFRDGEALADDAREQAQRAGNAARRHGLRGRRCSPCGGSVASIDELDAFLRTALAVGAPASRRHRVRWR